MYFRDARSYWLYLKIQVTRCIFDCVLNPILCSSDQRLRINSIQVSSNRFMLDPLNAARSTRYSSAIQYVIVDCSLQCLYLEVVKKKSVKS